MPNLGFDMNDVPDSPGFGPLPVGLYLARLKEYELKATKARDGQYLQLVWEIAEPAEFANRLVWDRLNIHNPNGTAQEIGRRQYKQMATAMGKPTCDDPDELVDGYCVLKLAIEKDKTGQFDDRNQVKAYSSVEGAEKPAAAAKPAAPKATAPAAPKKTAPPWARKTAA